MSTFHRLLRLDNASKDGDGLVEFSYEPTRDAGRHISPDSCLQRREVAAGDMAFESK